MSRSFAALMLLGWCCCDRLAVAGLPHRTAAEIQRQLRDSQDRIKSFYAIYEIVSAPDEDRPLGDVLHREVAMMGTAFVLHFNAHGNSKVHWSEDLRAQWALVTPTTVTSDWIQHRAHSSWKWDATKDEALPGSLPREWFFKATGLWPLDPRLALKSVNGIPFPLRLIADDETYATAEPPIEQIGDRLCHVIVREGLDRVWIDLERNCALLARELYEAPTGKCLQRIEHTEHAEVAPGIWLPHRIRQIRFDTSQEVDSKSVATADFVCDIKLWRVNDLSETDFTFRDRPGELWLNPPGNMPQQTQLGTDEYLDQVAAWSKRNGFARTMEPQAARVIDPCSVILLTLSGVVYFCGRQIKLGTHK